MDRREAMLRELNLYPLWVRRPGARQEPTAEAIETAGAVEAVGAVELPPVDRRAIEAPPVAEVLPTVPVSAEPVESGVFTERRAGLDNVAADLPRAAFDESVGDTPASPADDFFGWNLRDDEFDAPDRAGDMGGDSLREFQRRNADGALSGLDWPGLKQKVQNCEQCNLRAGCHRTVFGVGDEQAEWLFAGEAPGEDEDVTGEPFTGHAGRLLDNMLMAIKLKRQQVYIANVIKCRPPGDRHPHVGEVAACLPFLKRQIGLVKPTVIVALGKTAANALLGGDATIASRRGTVHDYRGIPLIVTYHPAYLLRSPMEKAKAWEDLCLAVDTLQGVQSGG